MNTAHRLGTALVLAIALAVAGPAQAATYRLDETSEQQIGCLWSCACLVLMVGPVQGQFTLTPAGHDATFDLYSVTGVSWVVKGTDGHLHTAVGAGTYRRTSSASAPQQRMELALSLDGTPELPFDSGLVPATATWPAIDVDVYRHKEWCFDTLYAVSAAPAPAGITPHASTRLAPPRPSPFRDQVELAFSLDTEAAVDLSIHDLAGRRVRTLVTGARMGAGPHSVVWDGYSDEGRRVPAGVLFVRFTAGRHTDRRLLVRVE